MAIYVNNKRITFPDRILYVYANGKLIWQNQIISCFSNGYWINNSPWTNNLGWKNE